MKPSAWALRHPIPVGIITAGAVLFGLLALVSLNREFIPPMVQPSASILTLWPGVGAEDVEKHITTVLEDHFATLSGLSNLRSESREGVSIILMTFTEDSDIGDVLQEVRARVDRAVEDLPDSLQGKPLVSTWGSSDLPVFSFAVFAPWDDDRLSRFVNNTVVPEIYRVQGVARVESLGTRFLKIEIHLDVDALSSANITPLEVLGALREHNLALPAGLVDWEGREWTFRVSGEFTHISDLENTVVGASSRGVPVQLLDVATVREAYEETGEVIRSNRNSLVVVQVTKREAGNAIRMSRNIRKRLNSLERIDEGAYRFFILHDDSQTINLSQRTVINSALTGIAMAVAVILFFLRNWRYTLVVALSLPVSLVIAFAGMRLTGQSVNLLTLAGITVSLGMVVDASIVVLENIHRRWSHGDDSETAPRNGADAVSGAVIASTTTSVSVFAPMLFLTGIIGSIMKDLSLTLVLTLSASLFSALFIIPPLMRRNLVKNRYGKARMRENSVMSRLERSYRTSLDRSLGMSGTVFFTAGVVLVVSILAADLIGISFIPSADYNELFISMELPPGTSLDEGAAAADRADALIRKEIPELAEMVFYVGMEDDLAGDARRREAVWGHLVLRKAHHRKRNFRSIIHHLNTVLPSALPGVSVTVLNGGFDRMVTLGTDGAGYRVELTSESWPLLRDAADRVESILLEDPAIFNTTRNVSEDRRFVTAELDGDAMSQLGVSATEAAIAARIAFEGMDVGEFRPTEGEDRDIRLTTSLEGSPPGPQTLTRLSVRNAAGRIVSFDAIASLNSEEGVSGIRRRNRARTLTVVGYANHEDVRGIGQRLKTVLAASPLPEGVEWRIQGVAGLVNDSLVKLGLVLIISLFLVYAVMAIQFERLVQPLIIMASVPFCFIGVVGGLAAFGSDISLISFLGIIALGGIVVNNAIVQVDKTNQLRKSGMSLKDAVLDGAVSRLRPIMMTTLTTFFGVIPLALARGSGARIYAPLGQAIAGGLITSTLVTLFLIPVLYNFVEKRREKKRVLAAENPASGAVNGVA